MKQNVMRTGLGMGAVLALAGMSGGAMAQTIAPVPGLGGSMVMATGLNNQGQVSGASTTLHDAAQHAIRVDQGAASDLGTLGGMNSYASGLNDQGQVIGDADTSDFQRHAFLHSNGVMVDLGTLGGTWSSAYALNEAGEVVGDSYLAGDYLIRAFLFSGGVMTDLGTLGGTYSSAVDINNLGQVLGQATTVNDMETHPFLYENGQMTDLGTLGGFMAMPFDLNDGGIVVGESLTAQFETRAFAYADGAMADLGTLGGMSSSAKAVNEQGQIIGQALITDNMEFHAFLFEAGQMMDLGTLGGIHSFANAINNLGDVVGEATDATGAMHAVLWRQGVIQNLNDLLPPGSGWQLLSAQHINDAGQVTGYGLFNGQFTHYVLTPSAGGDTTPPTILECAGDVLLASGTDGLAELPDLTGAVVAADDSTPTDNLVVTQDPAAGTFLPVGSHTVLLTVTDAAGNSADCAVTVTVELPCDLLVQSVTATPDVLRPPNRSMVPVSILVEAASSCGAEVGAHIVEVASSDPVTGKNDKTFPDVEVTGPLSLLLRAENVPDSPDRVYTVTVQVFDASGNQALRTVLVSVARSNAPGQDVATVASAKLKNAK